MVVYGNSENIVGIRMKINSLIISLIIIIFVVVDNPARVTRLVAIN